MKRPIIDQNERFIIREYPDSLFSVNLKLKIEVNKFGKSIIKSLEPYLLPIIEKLYNYLNRHNSWQRKPFHKKKK
jgi:hypothetical protein